jgi:hypothetical protein
MPLLKSIIISLVFTLHCTFAIAQTSLKFEKVGKDSFMKVDVATLIALQELSESDWMKLMKKNGFKTVSDQADKRIYSLGNYVMRIQLVSKNTAHNLLSIDWVDSFAKKTSMLKYIEAELKDFHIETSGGFDMYGYKGYLIGIEKKRIEYGKLSERILIRKQ